MVDPALTSSDGDPGLAPSPGDSPAETVSPRHTHVHWSETEGGVPSPSTMSTRPLGLEPATLRHLLSDLNPQVGGSSASLVLLGGPFKSQGLELASGMPTASGAGPCTHRQRTVII